MFTFSFVVEVRGQHKLQNAASSCNKEEYFDKGHFSWMDVVSTIVIFSITRCLVFGCVAQLHLKCLQNGKCSFC